MRVEPVGRIFEGVLLKKANEDVKNTNSDDEIILTPDNKLSIALRAYNLTQVELPSGL